MKTIITEAERDEIFAECERRGADAVNVEVQFSRYFRFPEKVAEVIVSQRAELKEDWEEGSDEDTGDIIASESNYLKYMQDNLTLLDVLKERYQDSDLVSGWERAASIIKADLIA